MSQFLCIFSVGSSNSRFRKRTIQVSARLRSSEGSVEGVTSKLAHVAVGRLWFLVGCQTEAPGPHTLLAGGLSQFFAMWVCP